MKRHDPGSLRPIFKLPIIGRLLLIGASLTFPLLVLFFHVTMGLWEERKSLGREWRDVTKAAFLPRVKEKRNGD